MAFVISNNSVRWPDGIMPYEISNDFDDRQRSTILQAIAHWNDITIMRLVARAGEQDFVLFHIADDSCSSAVVKSEDNRG